MAKKARVAGPSGAAGAPSHSGGAGVAGHSGAARVAAPSGGGGAAAYEQIEEGGNVEDPDDVLVDDGYEMRSGGNYFDETQPPSQDPISLSEDSS